MDKTSQTHLIAILIGNLTPLGSTFNFDNGKPFASTAPLCIMLIQILYRVRGNPDWKCPGSYGKHQSSQLLGLEMDGKIARQGSCR